MEKGDVYTKHVRGSRYAFNYGKLFYKYPGGAKNHAENECEGLYDDLCDVKQWDSGRVIVNEQKEITIYRKEDDHTWIPYYVGQLEDELKFEGMDNNPENLTPGLLWTGFASHHGAKYHLDMKGRLYYRETYFDHGVQTTKKYFVKDPDQDLVNRLCMIKELAGSFRINEHGHVFAPVAKRVLMESYNTDELNIEYIKEQFKHLAKEQKRTVQKYSEPKYSQWTRTTESWFPIYVGRYPEQLEILREDRPHRIIDMDSFYFGD